MNEGTNKQINKQNEPSFAQKENLKNKNNILLKAVKINVWIYFYAVIELTNSCYDIGHKSENRKILISTYFFKMRFCLLINFISIEGTSQHTFFKRRIQFLIKQLL